MSDVDFSTKIYEPVMKLLQEQDLKMDVVFVQQKVNRDDYEEEEWSKFMLNCFIEYMSENDTDDVM